MNFGLRQVFLIIACLMALSSPSMADVRIKDITSVYGARSNPIYGQGLVIGLAGTGDRNLASQQIAIDMLKKLEQIHVIARQSLLDSVYKSQNIAHVWVRATLPPFARKGSMIDVTVGTIGDAQSLQGGILILTPLRGADGVEYAIAEGPVSIGGFRVPSNIQGAQLNHPTVARLMNGGQVEKEALGQIDFGGYVRLLLRSPDFMTAKGIMLAINKHYPLTAKTIDAGVVQIRVPPNRRYDVPDFVSEITQLTVSPDIDARVVINERTGTVVFGNLVKISAMQIAHGNLSIKPNVTLVPAAGGTPLDQPATPSGEKADPVDDLLKLIRPDTPAPLDNPDRPQDLNSDDQTFTVGDLARVLNALGASPRDLIAIIQVMKDSGALHADVVVQ